VNRFIVKIKLITYVIFHFLWRWFKRPLLLLKHLNIAKQSILTAGMNGFIDDIFRRYLPKKYLLKTKICIKLPSSSIYSKLKIASLTNAELSTFKNVYQIDQKVNILVIRSGAMGDVILATPIIHMLHRKYDGLCCINVATRYPEVFRNNPYVTKILTIQEIRSLEHQFNLIIDLDCCYEKNRKKHITEAYSFNIFGAGVDVEHMQPELFPNDDDRTITKAFIEKIGGPYIVCHNRFDHTQPYRNLATRDWEDLILRMMSQTSFKVVQIGSKDKDFALKANNGNLIDARGILNLQQSQILISNAQLFLGVDAGPLHIAATTSTPIVCFFTIAHHNVRKPLRSKDTVFKAISPNIECYGCQDQFKFGIEWYCRKVNFPCISSFNMENAFQNCLSAIQQ